MRGYAAVRKNEFVRRAIQDHKVTSFHDICCGDLCWLDSEIAEACHLSWVRYFGDHNRAQHGKARCVSSLRFAIHDIAAEPLTANADL
ncbi:MAG: hypothetical protein ACREDD_12735, partial [Methylocella sp.]